MLHKMIVAGFAVVGLVGATAAQAQDLRASQSQLAPAPAKKKAKPATPQLDGANLADGEDASGDSSGTIVAVLAAAAVAGGIAAAASHHDNHGNSPN
jgi:hypothetical protein